MKCPSEGSNFFASGTSYIFMKAIKLKSDYKMLYTKRFPPLKRAHFFSVIVKGRREDN